VDEEQEAKPQALGRGAEEKGAGAPYPAAQHQGQGMPGVHPCPGKAQGQQRHQVGGADAVGQEEASEEEEPAGKAREPGPQAQGRIVGEF
jgi:hypothetical protein